MNPGDTRSRRSPARRRRSALNEGRGVNPGDTRRAAECGLFAGGGEIDTTTAAGRLVFGIFAALAEFERELDP